MNVTTSQNCGFLEIRVYRTETAPSACVFVPTLPPRGSRGRIRKHDQGQTVKTSERSCGGTPKKICLTGPCGCFGYCDLLCPCCDLRLTRYPKFLVSSGFELPSIFAPMQWFWGAVIFERKLIRFRSLSFGNGLRKKGVYSIDQLSARGGTDMPLTPAPHCRRHYREPLGRLAERPSQPECP